jgi:hypothetical protein
MLRHPLAREVAVIVALKMAIVIAAALFVFGPQRIHVTSNSIEEHVFHSPSENRQ